MIEKMLSWRTIFVVIREIVLIEDSQRHLRLLKGELSVAQRSTITALKLMLLVARRMALELTLLDFRLSLNNRLDKLCQDRYALVL